VIVTDGGAPADLIADLRAREIEVVVAQSEPSAGKG
jgi:hypothetical protein